MPISRLNNVGVNFDKNSSNINIIYSRLLNNYLISIIDYFIGFHVDNNKEKATPAHYCVGFSRIYFYQPFIYLVIIGTKFQTTAI